MATEEDGHRFTKISTLEFCQNSMLTCHERPLFFHAASHPSCPNKHRPRCVYKTSIMRCIRRLRRRRSESSHNDVDDPHSVTDDVGRWQRRCALHCLSRTERCAVDRSPALRRTPTEYGRQDLTSISPRSTGSQLWPVQVFEHSDETRRHEERRSAATRATDEQANGTSLIADPEVDLRTQIDCRSTSFSLGCRLQRLF